MGQRRVSDKTERKNTRNSSQSFIPSTKGWKVCKPAANHVRATVEAEYNKVGYNEVSDIASDFLVPAKIFLVSLKICSI